MQMTIINPATVVSPKAMISNLKVVWDGGGWNPADPDWSGWSMATFIWDDYDAAGLRWNGDSGGGVGAPQSRGIPVWFVLPKPIANIVLDLVRKHANGEDDTPRSRLADMLDFVQAVRAAPDGE